MGALVAALQGLRTIQAAMQEFDGASLVIEWAGGVLSTQTSSLSCQTPFINLLHVLTISELVYQSQNLCMD